MNISRFVCRLFLLAALCIGGTATAQQHREALILGDSIAFSYIASVGYDYFYTNPDNFIGFSDHLGRRFHLDVVNAACPGETTGSFLSSTAPDNGCRAFRSLYPLHADYKSTQLDFATTYLKSHREVRLVTITLGANDAFLLAAFQAVASDPAFGGKTCSTGLLNPDVYTPYVCNDHPAQTGHRLIAKTIADALRTADLEP